MLLIAAPSKGPAPAPTKPAQEVQNQTGPEQTKTKPDNKAPQNSPTTIQQTTPEITLRYEQYPGQQGDSKPPRDWWALANTGAVTLFTLALAILAYCQWRAMRRQATLMHAQARLMKKQLGEMETTSADTSTLATAAKDGAGAMLRQLEAYERPWVTVLLNDDTARRGTNFGFMDDNSAYVFIQPVVTNIGKSLATDISVYTELIARSLDDELSLKNLLDSRANSPGPEKFTLFPNEENRQIKLHKRVSKEAIQAAIFKDAFGKEYVKIIFIGEILYNFTNSKDSHHTQFAYLMAVKGAFGFDGVISLGATFSGDQISWIKLPGDDAN
jgi:hypothetical protein